MNMMKITALAAIALVAMPAVAADKKAAKAPAAAKTETGGEKSGNWSGGGGGGHSKRDFMGTYDADKDGRVSKQEFTAKRTEDHKGLDLNDNGTVNELEYVTEYTLRLDKDLAEQRARQIRQAHVRFGVLDTNKDGILSVEEYNASGDRMFSRLDTDEDGFVNEKDTAKNF